MGNLNRVKIAQGNRVERTSHTRKPKTSIDIESSALWDNHRRGNIGDYLKEKIHPDCFLSIVSAYFTIYAYEALKEDLDGIKKASLPFRRAEIRHFS